MLFARAPAVPVRYIFSFFGRMSIHCLASDFLRHRLPGMGVEDVMS